MMQPSPLRISERLDWDSILDLGHRRLHRTTQKEQVGRTPTRAEECSAPGDEPGLASLPIEFEICLLWSFGAKRRRESKVT